MGGRLDATNIVEPAVSVITDISLDHTEWLGSTVDLIAREKAGILRPKGVMITLPQHPEANQALGEVAVALGVRGVNAASYVPVHNHPEQYTRNRYPLSVMGELIGIDSPSGRRASTAQPGAGDCHRGGVKKQSWLQYHSDRYPGRHSGYGLAGAAGVSRGSAGRADVLLDVGHNPAGAWALRAAVSHLDRGQPLTLVFGCLKDKPVVELAQILFPLFGKVVVTPVDSPRSASIEDLLAAAQTTGSDVEPAAGAVNAVERALQLTPANGLVVVTGSVYLVGQVRSQLVAVQGATTEPLKV